MPDFYFLHVPVDNERMLVLCYVILQEGRCLV